MSELKICPHCGKRLKTPCKKLTEADVIDILSSSDTQKELAARYGVTQTNVSYIKRRKSWRHLS